MENFDLIGNLVLWGHRNGAGEGEKPYTDKPAFKQNLIYED